MNRRTNQAAAALTAIIPKILASRDLEAPRKVNFVFASVVSGLLNKTHVEVHKPETTHGFGIGTHASIAQGNCPVRRNLLGKRCAMLEFHRSGSGWESFPVHDIAEWTCMLCGTWHSPKKNACMRFAAKKTYDGMCDLWPHPAASWIQAHPVSWIKWHPFGLESLLIISAAQRKLTRGIDTSSLSREVVHSPVFHMLTLCNDKHT